MRHIGHILVLAYSGLIILFNYIPGAASSTDIRASGPWIIAIIVAALFALAAIAKLFKGAIERWSKDDISLSDYDIPDEYLFGVFTGFVLINLIAHGVLAAFAEVAGTLWYVGWLLADLLVAIVSFGIFKATLKKKVQAAAARPRSIRPDAA